MDFSFKATVIEWRGPSPFFYAPMPHPQAAKLREIAKLVTYGWGCIAVDARISGVDFATSLFPKDGTYLVPLKAAVRRGIGVTAGDQVRVKVIVRPANP